VVAVVVAAAEEATASSSSVGLTGVLRWTSVSMLSCSASSELNSISRPSMGDAVGTSSTEDRVEGGGAPASPPSGGDGDLPAKRRRQMIEVRYPIAPNETAIDSPEKMMWRWLCLRCCLPSFQFTRPTRRATDAGTVAAAALANDVASHALATAVAAHEPAAVATSAADAVRSLHSNMAPRIQDDTLSCSAWLCPAAPPMMHGT
jgi:hypothetical protein